MIRNIGKIGRKYEEVCALQADWQSFVHKVLVQHSTLIKALEEQKAQLINLFQTYFQALLFLPSYHRIASPPLPNPYIVPQALLVPEISTHLLSISIANPQVISIEKPSLHSCSTRRLLRQLEGLNEGTAHCVLSLIHI